MLLHLPHIPPPGPKVARLLKLSESLLHRQQQMQCAVV
jgi:hypothetical protein